MSSLLRIFRHNENGVTTIEFAFIATPFLLLIVTLLETALVHMTSLDLNNAVKTASRQIRTGQAQVAALTAQQFKNLVCDQTILISNCKTTPDLIIDVRSYDDFDTINTGTSDLFDNQGQFTNNEQYSLGSGLKVVVVRAYYKMSLLTQFPGVGLANIGSQHRMLDAVAVFRNEPFS